MLAQGKRLTLAAAFAAAIGLAAEGGAEAQDRFKLQSSADLLALCDVTAPGSNDVRIAQCNGFIAGTGLFYLELLRAGEIEKLACAPDDTTLDDARAAFVTWARGNPGQEGIQAVDGFWAAMSTRWPCRS